MYVCVYIHGEMFQCSENIVWYTNVIIQVIRYFKKKLQPLIYHTWYTVPCSDTLKISHIYGHIVDVQRSYSTLEL